jgi:hypothetical protein
MWKFRNGDDGMNEEGEERDIVSHLGWFYILLPTENVQQRFCSPQEAEAV